MWYICVSLTEELLGCTGGDHSVLHSHQQHRGDPVSPCPHPTVLIPMAKGCGQCPVGFRPGPATSWPPA